MTTKLVWSHVTKGTKITNKKYALYQPPERLGYSNPDRPISTKYISDLICPKGVTLSAAEIERMAQNRIAWKRLVLDSSKAIT